ncbi:sensor histidine kinase [Leptospira yasudae]|uniref:histidine kinase n=1 Tax=Leptospira yasudae TaxID=2202201 RepID=A0ABX9LZD2_9LEPT|nr:histidine kinase [Leptospira yasudae]TGK24482.1 sensor histidine kinase [Leptospira yasudae]TGM05732.1 sensor histidine kinase [Leptospira yasudae]
MSLLLRIKDLFKVPSPNSTHPNAWKKNIIHVLLLLSSCFGFLIYVPSVYLAWTQGLGEVVIIDTLALLLIWFLLLLPSKLYKPKSYFLLGLIFILGCLLYTKIGLGGAGILWFFLIPVFCGIFLSPTIALWGWALASVCVFSGALLAHYRIWIGNETPFQILVVGANFTFLCGILTFSIIAILRGLAEGIRKQKQLILLQRKTNKKLQSEISIRTEAESQLTESLNDKETLFREIQHRVKNNIQLILAMMTLEQEKTKSEPAKKAFASAMNRIQSMAMVQDYLFHKSTYKVIHAKDYLNSLVNHLFVSYGPSDGRIQSDCNIEEIFLPMDKAVPCGLIVNELLSNSFKHAFPDKRKGLITILFQKSASGYLTLEVADNGVGKDSADKDPQEGNSLGMNLIEALCMQLRGEMEVEKENGFRVKIRFFP